MKKYFSDVKSIVVVAIIVTILLSLIGCGSKKSVSQSQTKGKTDIELKDDSQINTKIEYEQELIDMKTKERIVTMYKMQLVPYPIDGDTIYLPVSYPIQKEEDREMSELMEKWKIKIEDSTQNAIELGYKLQIDEKNKKMLELKQSTVIYVIVATLLIIAMIIILVLNMKIKRNS